MWICHYQGVVVKIKIKIKLSRSFRWATPTGATWAIQDAAVVIRGPDVGMVIYVNGLIQSRTGGRCHP